MNTRPVSCLFGLFVLLSFVGFAFADENPKDFCFMNQGLKDTLTIQFTVSPDFLFAKGTIQKRRDGQAHGEKSTPFRADIKRSPLETKLFVTFEALPYPAPTVFTWIEKKKSTLSVPMYELDYKTKQRSIAEVVFEPCKTPTLR